MSGLHRSSPDSNWIFDIRLNHHEYQLPVTEVAPGTSIAIFDMLQDPQMLRDAATELTQRLWLQSKIRNQVQVIVAPECKSIPLAYELSVRLNTDMVILRKSEKLYNKDAMTCSVKSITTAEPQILHLDEKSYKRLIGRKALIVDDVVSTGATIYAIEDLLKRVPDCEIIGCAYVCAEGYEFDHDREDCFWLQRTPVLHNVDKVD